MGLSMGDSDSQGTVEQEKEWWEGVDTSTMDYLEFGAFEDAMTPEEYQRYSNREGE